MEKDCLWKGPTFKSEGQAGLSDEAQFWRTLRIKRNRDEVNLRSPGLRS